MTTPSDPGYGAGSAGGGQQPLVPPPQQSEWGQPDQAAGQYQAPQYQVPQYQAPQDQGQPVQGQQAPQWGQAGGQIPAYPAPDYYPAPPQPKRRNTKLIVRLAILAVIAIVVIVSALVKHMNAAKVDANGNVTKAGDLSIFSLKTGQCFNEPAVGKDVASITAIPCAQPHDAQVTGSTTLTETSYDATALKADAGKQCTTVAESAVDNAKVTADTGIIYFIPDQTAWDNGDRTATCAVDDSVNKLTGSVLTS